MSVVENEIRKIVEREAYESIYRQTLSEILEDIQQRLKPGKILVEVDPRYFRPTEVDILVGDYSKAKEKLGWFPRTKFKDLVKMMVDHDLKLAILEKYRKELIKE